MIKWLACIILSAALLGCDVCHVILPPWKTEEEMSKEKQEKPKNMPVHDPNKKLTQKEMEAIGKIGMPERGGAWKMPKNPNRGGKK
jgi:hypothetical protein